ncbi:MAG: hypothetical protein OHK0029_18920 [Armatimonadaceae bacterium]
MRSEDSPEPRKSPRAEDTPAPIETLSPETEHREDELPVSQNPPQPEKKARKKSDYGLTVSAIILCILAIAWEVIWHPCATILDFDPISHPLMGLLYALVVVTMGGNHWLLYARNPHATRLRESPRAVGVALVATVVSLLVASSAAFMFSPLLPLGVIAVIVFGIGLLILTPFWALLTLSLQLPRLLRLWHGATRAEVVRTLGAAGLAAFGLLFWLIGKPMLAAQYAAAVMDSSGQEQQRAIEKLRAVGGETILLDIAYNRDPSYWSCLGFNARRQGWFPWNGYNWYGGSVDIARQAYFLTTGKPFEHAPRPTSFQNSPTGWFGGPDDVAVEETGGMVVGRRVPGLSLKASRIEGTVATRRNVSEVSWTLRFRNDTDESQEARADILIPQDAVVHQVSLWINGEERQVRFGHPGKVRAAYQEVAVVQRRDPLLVTMPAPGHVLAQCFPVLPHSEIQIRIGFTLPLAYRQAESGKWRHYFDAPTLGEVNFAVPAGLRNELVLRTDVKTQPVIAQEWNGDLLFKTVGTPIGGEVPEPPRRGTAGPVELFVVQDASAGMNPVFRNTGLLALERALNSLPQGSVVHFADTAHPSEWVDWTPNTPLPADLLRRQYPGGTDPDPVLAQALDAAGKTSLPSAVVFLYAATPIHVCDLYQTRPALQKDYWSGPALVGIQMVPGMPDALFTKLAGFPTVFHHRAYAGEPDTIERLQEAFARAAAIAMGSEKTTLAQAQTRATGFVQQPEPTDLYTAVQKQAGSTGTQHERLALHSAVLNSWRYANTLSADKALEVRYAAGKAAAKARLVTPLSSAVVLETDEQYKKHGLEDDSNDPSKAKKSENFSSPEPGTLALAATGLLPFLLAHHRKRSRKRRIARNRVNTP